jgi:hypothetical protein
LTGEQLSFPEEQLCFPEEQLCFPEEQLSFPERAERLSGEKSTGRRLPKNLAQCERLM